ncbi:ROK family transcriptional regulator [Microlunatus speluncae]|uniref:ROK family transcriptional regulator n=1 Tax=Microlunatus speluncae TaxID=2594267 RepID=UPI001266667B|nr:ROK family transcriptional regulator [Microlunatus speluncae]
MPVEDPAGAAVRQANAAACLTVLRDQARPLTIAELAVATGLSRPTVNAVIGELVEFGPVRPSEARRSPGAGRPARSHAFDPAAGRVAGVDVGGGRIRAWVADLSGRLVGRAETPVPSGADGTERIGAIGATVERALADSAAEPGLLRGAGIGVPGILDHQGRVTRSLAVPDWVGIDLPGRLAGLLGCPVLVENDIKLAALAEQRLRGDDGDLVFLQVGHRISAALIMNGTILQGRHRQAGELGSLRGMRWTESSVRGRLRWRTATTGRAVFELARDGDQKASTEIAEFCAEIAPKIATLALTVDPALIVIGGGLSRAGDTLIRPLTKAVHHMLMTDDKPVVTASHLTSEGTLCGALGAAFETHSAVIFGVPGVPSRWQVWAEVPGRSSQPQPIQPQPMQGMIR